MLDASDLDETRRLLYMALFRPTKSDRWYNLAGTITNALVHHNLKLDAAEVMRHLRALCTEGDAAESEAWARGLIDDITARLEG